MPPLDPLWIVVLGWALLIVALYLLVSRWGQAGHVLRRLGHGAVEEDPQVTRERVERDSTRGALYRWLVLAGYRAPGAPAAFLLSVALALVAGVGLILVTVELGVFERVAQRAQALPPTVADLVIPLVQLTPWIVGLALVASPWLVVRNARRKRVAELERELPIQLDLLATLSESGLAFDAALAQILESDPDDSALVEEMQLFRLETLAGVPRIRCFRRLADRTRVGSMSIFCSAMVQAEQVGAGFSTVLRQQADDLRARRRERAMIVAQALPVKLVFPLVICFLPGIFLATLGPAFHEFLQYTQSILSTG